MSISTIEIVLYEGTKLILTTALRYFSSLEAGLRAKPMHTVEFYSL
ncbi:hypothetical protein HMPREF3185_00926 [Porphyromonas somerae]|uniref:Uncharacterized protein n=1 Tax=Porphyromonas somerae TaxID=322095 RepID=A0A134B9D2_9PORP|nr:hypothetical protein HMPREF3184_00926 [Porphyromonadaceae bacterium KA00676]KXB76556.1 hypothetical protein HMPREF3185_00926 [Porphyromonas somerae]